MKEQEVIEIIGKENWWLFRHAACYWNVYYDRDDMHYYEHDVREFMRRLR